MTPPVHLIIPGAAKAATTWYQHLLDWNETTWVPPHAQEIEFFDQHHERGLGWYEDLYAPAPPGTVTADVTPGYLEHPEVPARIVAFEEATGREVRLLVTLREPVSRFLSDYRMHQRKGAAVPPARAARPGSAMVQRGRYGTLLERYLEPLDRDRFLFVLFDDLKTDVEAVLDELRAFLGLDQELTDPYQGARVNQGGDRRIPAVDRALTLAGKPLRAMGMTQLLHRIKRSAPVQAIYDANRADPDRPPEIPGVCEALREEYQEDVRRLSRLIDRPDLVERWGYGEEPP